MCPDCRADDASTKQNTMYFKHCVGYGVTFEKNILNCESVMVCVFFWLLVAILGLCFTSETKLATYPFRRVTGNKMANCNQ